MRWRRFSGTSVENCPRSDVWSFQYRVLRKRIVSIGVVAQPHVVAAQRLQRRRPEHGAHARQNRDHVEPVAPKLREGVGKHVLDLLKARQPVLVAVSHENGRRQAADSRILEIRQHVVDRVRKDLRVGVEHERELTAHEHKCEVQVGGLAAMVGIGADAHLAGGLERSREGDAVVGRAVVGEDDFDVLIVAVEHRSDARHDAVAGISPRDDDRNQRLCVSVFAQRRRLERSRIEDVRDVKQHVGYVIAHQRQDQDPEEQVRAVQQDVELRDRTADVKWVER